VRALIVGASAGVGRALSELLAARGYDLVLLSSDDHDLLALAAHLRLMHGVQVTGIAADASQPESCLEQVKSAIETFRVFDSVFFPIGASRTDDRGLLSLSEAQSLLNVNLVTVVGVTSYVLPRMLEARQGTLVGFGSVAAIRGRGSNVVYAAAKRGLMSYFESLQHLTSHTGVHVHFYQLGYVATQQSFGKRLLFSPATPERIAETVVRNLGQDRTLTFLPGYWAFIARIVSNLPWPIFKRLDF
jgi:short-subunit dehydrogenase